MRQRDGMYGGFSRVSVGLRIPCPSMILAAPEILPGTPMQRLQCLLGLVTFCLIAWMVGRLRGARGVPWRVVFWGVALQFVFASVVLFAPAVLEGVQLAIDKLLAFTLEGSRMLFGTLVDGQLPAQVRTQDGVVLSGHASAGFIFAIVVLPTIIFVSLLTAVLYHLGIMTLVVRGLAWVMRRTMGTSGAETLSPAANIFVGQTEAPLVVRPFLAMATRSELMAIMVGGFANIATGVLVAYAGMLREFVPAAGGHLAAACFISAPATLLIAKLIMPETETPASIDASSVRIEQLDANLLDAATRGTSEGLALALNVGAMLIAFTALVALLNALISEAGALVGWDGLTLQRIFGWVFAPLAWLAGVSWSEAPTLGSLLGIKTVLNEFIAYSEMRDLLLADRNALSPRSALIATYALCGFANLASVGIQIGGISTLSPNRRAGFSPVGFFPMVGGAFGTLVSAWVGGILP